MIETRHVLWRRTSQWTGPIAPWELRLGQLRVFYEVVSAEGGVVRIFAVGRKRRNMLLIGNEEIHL